MLNILAFNTADISGVFVFGVLNARNLAFSTQMLALKQGGVSLGDGRRDNFISPFKNQK